MPVIQEGAQGLAVRVLHKLLKAAGCNFPCDGMHGRYGPETVAAVKAFQTTHSLHDDGICGPLTWAALAG